MKKLIIAITAIAVIGVGGSTAHGQELDPDAELPLPIECSEQDENAPDTDGDGIPDECVDFYIDQEGSPPPGPGGGESAPPPPPAPGGGSSSPTPQGSLPRTGSGTSLPLQIGAILLVMGGIGLVAAKRRGPATAG